MRVNSEPLVAVVTVQVELGGTVSHEVIRLEVKDVSPHTLMSRIAEHVRKQSPQHRTTRLGW